MSLVGWIFAEEWAFLCRRAHRLQSKSGPFASPRASSCASLSHENNRSGRTSIYTCLSVAPLSVVCTITTSLTCPLLLLTLIESIQFYRHTQSLTYLLTYSYKDLLSTFPSLDIRAPNHSLLVYFTKKKHS